MADNLTRAQRSALMSRIRGKNTGLELRVFRALRRRGVYFAKHAKELPGRPDVVFRNGKLAVFLDGDFWHGWRFPRWEAKLAPFWRDKIRTNRRRDRRTFSRLRRMEWKVLRIWGHELDRDLDAQIDRILRVLAERRRRG